MHWTISYVDLLVNYLVNEIYSQGLASKYKIYRFHYVSEKYSVWEIARALRNDIDDAVDAKAIKDSQLVILAHSMGGLVARSYMNEHSHRTGIYGGESHTDGQRGGERILKLITLATPHHGSPAANHDSRNELADNANHRDSAYLMSWKNNSQLPTLVELANDWSSLVKIASFARWHTDVIDHIKYNEPNRKDLLWDNFDLIMDGFNSDVIAQTWLPKLNSFTAYDNKTILYYGYLDPESYEYKGSSYKGVVDKVHDKGPVVALLPYALSDDGHNKLLSVSIALNYGLYYYESCLQSPDSNTPCSASGYSPYAKNDGAVPLQSAAFDGHTVAKRVECPNYDHYMMRGNDVPEAQPSAKCANGLTVLDSVASDLNGIYTESYLGKGDPTDSNGFNDPTIGQKFINTYNNNGGEAKIGYPINYVHKWGDYWVEDFRLPVSDTSGFGNSIMIYNPTKNAVYLLHGAIWAVYESISGVNSRLGLPISNEESFPVCDNRLNMIQRFANGYITRLPGESYYKEYVYTDDTQDPSVTITFPTNGSTIIGKDKYIAASATDNIYARKIILYLDGKLVGILNPSQTCGQFTTLTPFDTTLYPNGSYTLVAEAYDMSERVGKSQISVTISNSVASGGNNAPDIPQALYQYKSDGVAGIGAGEPTNERIVVMKGNVFDTDGGSVSLEVEVKAVGTLFDGKILSNCVPDNPNPSNSGGTAVVRCTNLKDGQYKWRARSKDDKGVYGGWNEAGGNADTAADFIVYNGPHF